MIKKIEKLYPNYLILKKYKNGLIGLDNKFVKKKDINQRYIVIEKNTYTIYKIK